MRRACLVMLLLSLLCHPGWAAGLQHYALSLLVTDDAPRYQGAIEKIQERFSGVSVNSTWPATPANQPRLVLTLGLHALHIALGKAAERDVVVALFTSRDAFYQARHSSARSGELTAIYADPAPAHQFRLIRRLTKHRVRVGVLMGKNSAYSATDLQQAAARENITLAIEQMSSPGQLGEKLQSLSTYPVLLALPDDMIYRPDTIRSILLATYRRRQVVIGYSAAMVKAGALATTLTSAEDIVTQLEEVVQNIDRTRRVPAPQFPKYFSVMVNPDVARSFELATDDMLDLSFKPASVNKP